MSSGHNEDDAEATRQTQESIYKVGNKKPPLNSRFKPGQSGNPKGRPKGHKSFPVTLLREFDKSVSAIINGKPVKATNRQLFATSLVKNGITGGAQAKKLLWSLVSESEKFIEKTEGAKKKLDPEEPIPEFSWTDEQEQLYQEMEACVTARELSGACPQGGSKTDDHTH
jgi:hypothetical protein